MTTALRHAALKKLAPAALEDSLIKSVIDNNERIRNDPEVQQRRAAARDETNRELVPVLVAGIVLNGALYGAAAWYLPAFVTPAFAVLCFGATSALLWRALHAG
jgi:hypothetical protein